MDTVSKVVEILLVEDNPLEAELTIRGLTAIDLGKNLLHLNTGPDAIDFIFATGKYEGRNSDELPKIILLDINIPKVNGLEILKKIKSDKKTKKIPVVMFTTSRDSDDIDTSFELGANSYVVKPVDYSKFESVISKLGEYWTRLNELPFNLNQ